MPPKEKSKELKHRNIICLKLTDIELEILNQAASSVGISRSEYPVSYTHLTLPTIA